MRVLNLKSQESPELNAKILRSIENLVCCYREVLPKGWRCCIKFQNWINIEPYFTLDVQSNQGGGDFAPVKMQMLKLYEKVLPNICGTGIINTIVIEAMLKCIGLENDRANELYGRLKDIATTNEITDAEWESLKDLGITRRYGGIRIPYDILTTDVVEPFLADERAEQFAIEKRGEIRITFSGAKEWQDTFFCFSIFKQIQKTLNSLWSRKQIWYNLRGFQDDPCLSFWVKNLGIAEAPED